MVTTLAAEFDVAERLVVVIPPGGTRGWSDHWKSGFDRVAFVANGRRHGVDSSVYADKSGKLPDRKREIRLRPEPETGWIRPSPVD